MHSLKKGTDDNWEGFQKVDEHNESKLKVIVIEQGSHVPNNHSENQRQGHFRKKKQKLLESLKLKEKSISQYKNRGKQKLVTMLPEITGESQNMRQNSPIEQQSSAIRIKPNLSLSPTKKPTLDTRIPRIPVFRHQQQCRFAANIVYKGFAPRSSDSYIRGLKDVNFESRVQQLKSSTFQKDIEFHSKFEGGNLNIVYEDCKQLV